MHQMEPRRRSCGLLVLLLVLLVVPTACDDDGQVGPGPLGPVGPVGADEGVAGSGTVVAERREVGDFTGISLAGEGRVVVTIADGAALVIEADDNLQQYLQADVGNGLLSLSTSPGIDIAPSQPPVFNVSMAEIDTIVLAGAGSIDLPTLEVDGFVVTLSGVGDITVPGIRTTEIVAEVSGVGSLLVAGRTDRLVLSSGGVSTFEGHDLEARLVEVVASGSGQARIWATGEIDIRASGNALVEFYGEPAVTETTEDAGSVVRLGAKP